MTDPIRIAFVCVQNAGRSQMATAFAKQERVEHGEIRKNVRERVWRCSTTLRRDLSDTSAPCGRTISVVTIEASGGCSPTPQPAEAARYGGFYESDGHI